MPGAPFTPGALPFRRSLAEGGVVDLAFVFALVFAFAFDLKCHPERSEGPPYGSDLDCRSKVTHRQHRVPHSSPLLA